MNPKRVPSLEDCEDWIDLHRLLIDMEFKATVGDIEEMFQEGDISVSKIEDRIDSLVRWALDHHIPRHIAEHYDDFPAEDERYDIALIENRWADRARLAIAIGRLVHLQEDSKFHIEREWDARNEHQWMYFEEIEEAEDDAD